MRPLVHDPRTFDGYVAHRGASDYVHVTTHFGPTSLPLVEDQLGGRYGSGQRKAMPGVVPTDTAERRGLGTTLCVEFGPRRCHLLHALHCAASRRRPSGVGRPRQNSNVVSSATSPHGRRPLCSCAIVSGPPSRQIRCARDNRDEPDLAAGTDLARHRAREDVLGRYSCGSTPSSLTAMVLERRSARLGATRARLQVPMPIASAPKATEVVKCAVATHHCGARLSQSPICGPMMLTIPVRLSAHRGRRRTPELLALRRNVFRPECARPGPRSDCRCPICRHVVVLGLDCQSVRRRARPASRTRRTGADWVTSWIIC